MYCRQCGAELGTIISLPPDRLARLQLEFLCPACAEKAARSLAISVDPETSWGKLAAKLKGER
jgi:hypothetical protein